MRLSLKKLSAPQKQLVVLVAAIAIAAVIFAVNPFQTAAQNVAPDAIAKAAAPTTGSAPSTPAAPAGGMILPTAEDKQLAQRLISLVAELDKPPSPGREIVNRTRGAETTNSINALQSEVPVSTRTLSRARRYINEILPHLEELRALKSSAPSYIAQKRGTIVLDGKLDEATWKRAVEMPIQFQNTEKIADVKAEARLLWDAQFLYAGFEVRDSNIVAPVTARDGEVWRNDCVEIFLMPSQRFGTYWEIELSPTGSILDYLCYKYSNQWGSDLNKTETVHGLQVAGSIRGTANQADDRDEGYTIEVTIPFNQIPGMQKGAVKGDRIYALLGWINNDSEVNSNRTTALAQVPYTGWFHNVWSYQPFELVSKIPKPVKK